MRLVVIALLLVVGCEDEAPTIAPPPAATAATAKQVKDCRDMCEQRVLVEHLGDAELRACRARCDGHAPPTANAPAHEVPSRITRSAPVSRPPAVQPVKRDTIAR
jgi:hypothetical protein